MGRLQNLNPFGSGGYVRLPTSNEGPGAPLPAPTRREEEEGFFACKCHLFRQSGELPLSSLQKMSNFTASMRNHSKFPPHSPLSHPRQACKSSDLDLHTFWCIWVLMSGLVTGPLFTAQVYGLRCTSQNPMSFHKSQELHGCNMSLSCPQASSSRRPLDP